MAQKDRFYSPRSHLPRQPTAPSRTAAVALQKTPLFSQTFSVSCVCPEPVLVNGLSSLIKHQLNDARTKAFCAPPLLPRGVGDGTIVAAPRGSNSIRVVLLSSASLRTSYPQKSYGMSRADRRVSLCQISKHNIIWCCSSLFCIIQLLY
jgi:hypothetical protein